MTTNNRKLFGITVLIIAIISIDAQTFFTNGRYGKRSDLRLRVASRSGDESRFFGGPRFGRSGGGSPVLGSAEIDSRNPERFFIGSRYGKRSGDEQVLLPSQVEEMLPEINSLLEKNSFASDKDVLECISTGVDQLYHCTKKSEKSSNLS